MKNFGTGWPKFFNTAHPYRKFIHLLGEGQPDFQYFHCTCTFSENKCNVKVVHFYAISGFLVEVTQEQLDIQSNKFQLMLIEEATGGFVCSADTHQADLK